MPDKKIFLALGFHVNYNHSWRGDRNDESGFGVDSRIIRRILEILDAAEKKGLSARGVWDFDNFWSLENIMPRYAPDLLENIVRRVKAGKDEAILGVWNNGLISASTKEECRETILRTISNKNGSGVKDLFGAFSPVIRTQETMFSQGNIEIFTDCGIEAIALYYSSVPFDSIINFVKPLTPNQMYNPLWLKSTESEAKMLMIPMYNPGELVNRGSLLKWVKDVRSRQINGEIPGNALIYLNMDADADIWTGLPGILGKLPGARGLEEFIELVSKLDYLEFGTLADYIKNNPAVGEITVRQDLADGAYTGYNNWSEKEENQRLWRLAERARALSSAASFASEVMAPEQKEKTNALLVNDPDSYFENRIKLLSTTHFGMHSPSVNFERAQVAFHLARNAYEKAAEAAAALEKLVPLPAPEGDAPAARFSVLDYPEHPGGKPVPGARTLVKVPLKGAFKCSPGALTVLDSDGKPVPFDFQDVETDGEGNAVAGTMLVQHTSNDKGFETYNIVTGGAPTGEISVTATDKLLSNDLVSIGFDDLGRISSLKFGDEDFSSQQLLSFGGTYEVERNRKRFSPRAYLIEKKYIGPKGSLASIDLTSSVVIFNEGKNYTLKANYRLSLFAGLPYLFIDGAATYPQTPATQEETGLAAGSSRKFDMNWFEAMPAAISPAIHNLAGKRLRVWKHNYMDATNYYDLDFGDIHEPNRNLDSFNNHVTNGWIAVSNTEKGLLIGTDSTVNSSSAFCPMKLRERSGKQSVTLNPFGTYHGKQFSHLADGFSLGVWITRAVGAQFRSVAPSYNGKTVPLSLMLAPYIGDAPPEQLRSDASRRSLPPMVVLHEENGSKLVLPDSFKKEFDDAVEEYGLEAVKGWTYGDFLTARNEEAEKSGAPKAKGASPYSIIKSVIDGIKAM